MLWRCNKIDRFKTKLLIFPSFIVICLFLSKMALLLTHGWHWQFSHSRWKSESFLTTPSRSPLNLIGLSLVHFITKISLETVLLSCSLRLHSLRLPSPLTWYLSPSPKPACGLHVQSTFHPAVSVLFLKQGSWSQWVDLCLRGPLLTFPLQILLTSCLLNITDNSVSLHNKSRVYCNISDPFESAQFRPLTPL